MDLTRYNNLLRSKFKGMDLLLEVPEENHGFGPMRVYYLDSKYEIGISHGPDCWIASPETCLLHTNLQQMLEARHAQKGKTKRIRIELHI